MPAITFFANAHTVVFIRRQRLNESESDAKVVARLMREMAGKESVEEWVENKYVVSDDDLFEETNLDTIVRRGK